MTDHDVLLARLLWRADGWLDDDFDEKGMVVREWARRLCDDHPQPIRVLAAEVRRLDAVTAERDALRRIVRRFGPPPGGLLLDPDEADALRHAIGHRR